MTWLIVGVVSCVTLATLAVAVHLGRPQGRGDAPRDEVDRLVLWSRVDTVRRELRRSIEARTDELSLRLREALERYGRDLERAGAREVEEVTEAVRQRARRHFQRSWFWSRVSFDVRAYVEHELLPPIVERYDAFRAREATRLRACVEGILGTSVEAASGAAGTRLGTRAPGATGVRAVVGAGASGALALAHVGGSVVAAPAAALGAALLAGWALKNYRSKRELVLAAADRAERVARCLFHGEGYRNPADGALVPSATAWLLRTAADLEVRLERRLEHARDEQLRRIDERYHALELRWRQDQVPPAHLQDPGFLVAALHPTGEEAARG